jgi:rare lipoprotein A
MNQKLLSGFTATLLMATLGVLPSYADQTGAMDESSTVKVSAPSNPLGQEASTLTDSPDSTPTDSSTDSTLASRQEVIKVGEYQSQEDHPEEAVTAIHSHELAGRQAVTLYVRSIPVLTFLGSNATAAAAESLPPIGGSAKESDASAGSTAPVVSRNSDSSEIKVASTQNNTLSSSASAADKASPSATPADQNDPMWRATETAARLNQLHRNNVDASTITVEWNQEQQRYVIKAGSEELVAMDTNIILPNTTQNPNEDALQATNLIRRQLGNAPPLESVSGQPQPSGTFTVGSVQFRVTGWASWYGPGFDGNYSASGEVFNQNAMTAAHPDLPFGTQVRVTNMDNGESVVVRINDRGPYAGDRIIDLSRGAAAAIGLVQSGVAPVTLEVLGTANAVAR